VRQASAPTPAPTRETVIAPDAAAVPAAATPASATPASATPAGARPTVPEAWEQTVKAQVKPIVRALYSAGSFVGNTGDTWQFSVPNEAHGARCGEHRAAVEAALAKVVGAPVTVEFVVGARGQHDDEPVTSPRPVAPTPPVDDQPTDEIDLSDLTDAPPESVKTPLDRLAEAFPGSEFVTER
jgi:hypothetical protein